MTDTSSKDRPTDRPILLPPAVVEAAAKELAMQCRCEMACDWRSHLTDATAALDAALKAWPGMEHDAYEEIIILPLPQDANNAL